MKKVYIAGHKGLVGSAIERVFTKKGYKDIIKRTIKGKVKMHVIKGIFYQIKKFITIRQI